MRRRVAAVFALLAAMSVSGLVAAVPASALDIGDHYSPDSFHLAVTLAVFVGIPLGVLALVSLFVMRPPRSTGALRYRPGRPWGFAPVWFGTKPDSHMSAQEQAASDVVPGAGGAHGSW
jgi:hypothetical protein